MEDKIFLSFKVKDKKEWFKVQDFLFSLGYNWEFFSNNRYKSYFRRTMISLCINNSGHFTKGDIYHTSEDWDIEELDEYIIINYIDVMNFKDIKYIIEGNKMGLL